MAACARARMRKRPRMSDAKALDDPRCDHPGCDAVASVAWEFTSRTSEGVAGGARLQCAAGHWYTRMGPDVQDPFEEEALPPDLWD